MRCVYNVVIVIDDVAGFFLMSLLWKYCLKQFKNINGLFLWTYLLVLDFVWAYVDAEVIFYNYIFFNQSINQFMTYITPQEMTTKEKIHISQLL